MSNYEPTKSANMVVEYTAEQLMELIKCADPVYFIENYVKVQHPTKGMMPLVLYDFQKEMVRAYHNHRKVVALCSRQMGKTTTAAAFLLHWAMFNDDQTILICSNVYRASQEIMLRVRTAYEECPDFIRAGVRSYNRQSIEFDNGSRIVSQATTENTGRGMSISLLYCDELAHANPRLVEAMMTSLAPTLSTGGKAIITSTPLTDIDTFANIWFGANDTTDEFGNPDPKCANGVGKNGYYPFQAIWSDHPDRDEAWGAQELASMGKDKFAQEHCNAFGGESDSLINQFVLSRIKCMKEPLFYTGTVRWYVEPEPNKTYLIALDPSLGTGGDYSAIQVFSIPDMEQVAEWQSNTTPVRDQVKTMLQILHTLDGELRDHPNQHGDPEIYWTVENNSIGEAVLVIIEDTGEDRFPGQMINEKKKKGQSRKFRKGLNTTSAKKLSACARMKSLIESDRMKLNSRNLITELKNFVASGSGFAAKSGTHDDLVSATLLITRMLEIVIDYSGGGDALKERIGDDEVWSDPDDVPLPTVV